MPGQGFSVGGDFGATLVDLVNEGAVPVDRIDDMVLRSVSQSSSFACRLSRADGLSSPTHLVPFPES